MNLLAVLLTVAACILPYLCSKQQNLIKGLKWHSTERIKKLCWLAFFVLSIAAAYCLSFSFSWVVASIQVLTIIMSICCVLSICAAHWPNRVLAVTASMTVLFIGIALLGASS